MPKPLLLVITPFADDVLQPLESCCEIVRWRALPAPSDFLRERGPQVRAVITNGLVGLPAGSAEHLTGLELIACNGVGYDAIDVAWARARASILYLSVFTENHRAQAFYRRYGFTDVGRNAFRVGNHIDEDRFFRLDL